jgi:hypothetical protein
MSPQFRNLKVYSSYIINRPMFVPDVSFEGPVGCITLTACVRSLFRNSHTHTHTHTVETFSTLDGSLAEDVKGAQYCTRPLLHVSCEVTVSMTTAMMCPGDAPRRGQVAVATRDTSVSLSLSLSRKDRAAWLTWSCVISKCYLRL